MIRLANAPAAKVKSLAQQQADFTAEGSPPPGQVAGSLPVTAGKAVHVAARTASRADQQASTSKSP